MPNFPFIHTILVPKGAEHQAVCRGLSQITGSKPNVVSIPMGMQPLRQYLAQWNHELPSSILLMGLCGSLNALYTIGDIVLYEDCFYHDNSQECENTLTKYMQSRLGNDVSLVTGLSSDRLIWSASEKRDLGEKSGADVVDMEGFAALEFSQRHQIKVGILRVVSDDSHYDIPDLSSAISPEGSLQTLALGWGLLQQPLAAIRLIRGSLKGLKVLEQVTRLLFT